MSRGTKPLLDRTYELLDGLDWTERTIPEVAQGANVGAEWLKKLRARTIEDPSVRRIQRLHDFLAGLGRSKGTNQVARGS